MGKVWGLLSDRTILLLFLGIFFVVGIDVATNFISSKVMIARFGWDTSDAGVAPSGVLHLPYGGERSSACSS